MVTTELHSLNSTYFLKKLSLKLRKRIINDDSREYLNIYTDYFYIYIKSYIYKIVIYIYIYSHGSLRIHIKFCVRRLILNINII